MCFQKGIDFVGRSNSLFRKSCLFVLYCLFHRYEFSIAFIIYKTNAGLNITTFQTGVYNFLKTVRLKNPNAQIIWAYGMRNDKLTAQVDAAIQAAVAQLQTEGDSKMHYLALPLAADMHLNHPTAAAYEPSGELLIEKIEEITGW